MWGEAEQAFHTHTHTHTCTRVWLLPGSHMRGPGTSIPQLLHSLNLLLSILLVLRPWLANLARLPSLHHTPTYHLPAFSPHLRASVEAEV